MSGERDTPAATDGGDTATSGPTLVEADPSAGFHYPYFFHVPESVGERSEPPVLVEPTSSPRPSDDFGRHLDMARKHAEGGTGRRVADELSVPFLTPVFPRPVTEPVDWRQYVHSLDAETLRVADEPLERVDRQLLDMVADARDRLADRGIDTREQFLLNGFSASGSFANRFAALHPERVLSVTAGGLNGMAILPRREARGHTLPYPIGVADLVELTGEPFDPDAFRTVDQFLYMGGEDDNDTIPYPDAWTDDALAGTALAVYGRDMHGERFPYCQQCYEDAGVSALFRIYEGVGHRPAPVEDLVAFHRRSIEGEDAGEMRDDIGGEPPADSGEGDHRPGLPLAVRLKRRLLATLAPVYLRLSDRMR